jgi:hypothetical protein
MTWHLANLTASAVVSGVDPWAFVPAPPIPAGVRENKKARTAWILRPSTQHHVYSFVEATAANQRVSLTNPPFALHGLALDYDCPVADAEIETGLGRATHIPTWFERTMSGNFRPVWVFAEPLRVPGYVFTKGFLPFLAAKLNAELIAAGLDKAALGAPERYYTNSCDWFTTRAEPLPSSLLHGWLLEFSAKFAFTHSEFGSAIPLEEVAEKLAARYPRFSTWPGNFVLGAQGPSFWVDGSTSPKSAIVRETGIQTFAAHATKAFYSWADLIGEAAVSESTSHQLGRAVEGLYFDGKHYHRQLVTGDWKPFDRSDVREHLRVVRQVSAKPDKTGVSNIERAMQHIQDHQHIVGAAPFVFRPSGILRFNGQSVLNTSARTVCTPVEIPTVWGADGGFPFISTFLESLFDPPTQLEVFLAWLSRFYASGYAQRPSAGQNMFIAGGKSIGKTLLNRRIIGPLLGGYAEATDYLLGRDDFGSELFESALWAVDDSGAATNASDHRRFSEIVKKLAANNTFRWHAKFRVPMLIQWQGRVVVTCNRDEESIRILPDLSMTILDKLILLRGVEAHDPRRFRFPDAFELELLLERELPYFARWLLDHNVPVHLIADDPRFGIISYHDESLVATAHQSSRLAAFVEILHDWREAYFHDVPDEAAWQGTAFQLHKAFNSDPNAAHAMRAFSVDAIGRSLAALRSRGDTSIRCEEDDSIRVWTIDRPAKLPLVKKATRWKIKPTVNP